MEKILDLYRQNYPIYNDFINQIQEIVTTLLMGKNIHVHSVVSRIKEERSLQNKINKNFRKYTKIEDITDLCGLRIITYFEDEVDQIAEIIQKTLAIDPINSVDKRNLLPATQFGYLSVHIVASLTTIQLQLPKYKKFKNCKIEIQICSILQHAWAEIEHDLGYKSRTAISYDARRSFSRLASLLEIADIEFRKLRNDLQPPRALVPKPVLTSVIQISEKNALATVHEKLIKKNYFVKALGGGIVERNAFSLKRASGCTIIGIVVLLLTNHLAPITHLLFPVITALKTEKAFLISMVSIHIPV